MFATDGTKRNPVAVDEHFTRERSEEMNQSDPSFDLVANYTLKADSLARKGWFKCGAVGVKLINRSSKRHSSSY